MKSLSFCPDMARAFRAGRKTLTSRNHGLAEVNEAPEDWSISVRHWRDDGSVLLESPPAEWVEEIVVRPRFAPGDRFYVREPWAVQPIWNNTRPKDLPPECDTFFMADLPASLPTWALSPDDIGRIRAGRYLPARLARSFGVVRSVTIKRVQEITQDEAWNEGFRVPNPIAAYMVILDRLYGTGTWDRNPWRWFYEIELEGA